MKKIVVLLSLFAFIVSCKNDKNKEAENTDNQVIALADFEAKAGELVDKEIQIVGIVDHVCKHGGKKLFMVSDEGEVHVDGEERFDDALTGSEIIVKGIVREQRIDEAYLSKEEENYIKKHKNGVDADSMYTKKMEYITMMRDSLKKQGVDHFSNYSVEYISHIEKK